MRIPFLAAVESGIRPYETPPFYVKHINRRVRCKYIQRGILQVEKLHFMLRFFLLDNQRCFSYIQLNPKRRRII